MTLVHAGSLAATVNEVEDRLFWQKPIAPQDRAEVTAWITERQGLPRAYRGTYALFDAERQSGIRLFTGERVTNAAARHIIGEETMRVLRQLQVTGAPRAALDRAAQGIKLPAVGNSEPKPADGQLHWLWPWRTGTYCCGACSVALWRNMLAGGFDHQEERLQVGLRCLRQCRKGRTGRGAKRSEAGEWRVFPYWYTMLTLSEMDSQEARAEMRYGIARCQRAAQQTDGNIWARRRTELAKRILAKV